VEVDKSSARGTLDVVLASSSAQLDGVVMQNEKPAVGSRVGIVPDPETPFNHNRIRSVLTDQAGRFLFDSIAPGKYRVSARLAIESDTGSPLHSESRSISISQRSHETASLTIAAPEPQ
jgi:hypothetical protein